MIVAVDAGNSRTKWGVFEAGGALLRQGVLDNDDLSRLTLASNAWQGCRRAVVANVAGKAVERQLGALFEACRLPVLWVQAQASLAGVSNGYAEPAQLGSDRWAALVAAWNRHRAPCVVVLAGTALTVDALSSKGEFLGGLILPGRAMMRQALADGTAALSVEQGECKDFPVCSKDAIISGVAFSMAGAVERQCAMLAR
jgi:type III pantothenate kinase